MSSSLSAFAFRLRFFRSPRIREVAVDRNVFGQPAEQARQLRQGLGGEGPRPVRLGDGDVHAEPCHGDLVGQVIGRQGSVGLMD